MSEDLLTVAEAAEIVAAVGSTELERTLRLGERPAPLSGRLADSLLTWPQVEGIGAEFGLPASKLQTERSRRQAVRAAVPQPTRRRPARRRIGEGCNRRMGWVGQHRCEEPRADGKSRCPTGHRAGYKRNGKRAYADGYGITTRFYWSALAFCAALSLSIGFGVDAYHDGWIAGCYADGQTLGFEARIDTYKKAPSGAIGGPDFCLFNVDGVWRDRRELVPSARSEEWEWQHPVTPMDLANGVEG